MNDRYLFRGKVIRDYPTDNLWQGDWVKGSLFGAAPCILKLDLITKPFLFAQYLIDSQTIGQCTGLKDKNGNLIFEGDIVSYVCDQSKLSDKDLFKHHIKKYIIVWSNTKYYFEEINPEFERYHEEIFVGYEIIGNKWDNQELLEK